MIQFYDSPRVQTTVFRSIHYRERSKNRRKTEAKNRAKNRKTGTGGLLKKSCISRIARFNGRSREARSCWIDPVDAAVVGCLHGVR